MVAAAVAPSPVFATRPGELVSDHAGGCIAVLTNRRCELTAITVEIIDEVHRVNWLD